MDKESSNSKLHEMLGDNSIDNPEGAVFRADQELFDAGDPTAKFTLSVHEVEGKAVCNFWESSLGNWHRVMPERTTNLEPSPAMLQGELIRFSYYASENPNLQKKVNDDMRIKLGIFGLQNAVKNLIESE